MVAGTTLSVGFLVIGTACIAVASTVVVDGVSIAIVVDASKFVDAEPVCIAC